MRNINNNYKPYQWRLWLIFIAIFAISIAAVFEHSHSKYKHNQAVSSNITSLADQLNAVGFNRARQDLFGISKMPGIISTARGDNLADNPEVLAAITAASFTSEANIIYLLNASGTTVACTPFDDGKTFTGNNYAFRPYFSNVINSGEPAFYAALGVTTNLRGIYVSVPVINEQEVLGVLVAKLPLTEIDRCLNNRSCPVALVSPDGVVFASNQKEWLFKTVWPITQEKRNEILATKQFADEPLEPLGSDFLQASLVVDGKNYEAISVEVMTNNHNHPIV
ncbi:MAG: hypothetical protein JEZ07_06630 [Phycisphaerae bacterium]|nr:hypothetical protein [Phycisphaerae bacterium]